MTARLTVVLDDDDLYRRAKVRAAEEGIPMKHIVEEALSAYLARDPATPKPAVTGADILAWMAEARANDDDPDGPTTDYSDIKHYLYGYPKQRVRPENWGQFVAEERAKYDSARDDD